MQPGRRVIVVGAGIVGAACARALAQGGCSVVVVDPRPVGSGATAAGMGHIVVMDDGEAQFALTHYSQSLWRRLAPELPADCEYRETGTMWVAADREEMEWVARKSAYYAERGVPTEILAAHELERAEPQLRRGLAGGLRVPNDGVLYPPCAARWLLGAAQNLGAQLRRDAVVELAADSVLLAGGERLAADAIVNATGCGAERLQPGLPVRPRKGHLLITDRYPGFLSHQVLELGYLKSAHGAERESVAFNVQPRATGQLLIGSSRQYDAPTAEVEPPIVRRMVDRAREFMPALAGLSVIRIWTGYRAATGDGLPLVGPDPTTPGLFWATGHEGLGITTSLATAEIIAAQVLDKPAPIDPAPYLPSRTTREKQHA